MTACRITSAALACATGVGIESYADALTSGRSGLAASHEAWPKAGAVVGRVAGLEDISLRSDLADYDCRNNRLAQVGLEADGFAASVARVVSARGAERVGVVLGTSTSGIAATERAYAERHAVDGALPDWFKLDTTHAYNSLASFVRAYLGLSGPAYVVSTACSSGSKAVVDACQLVRSGICDAVVAGGVDTLCELTLGGFASLELIDPEPARPFDVTRAGINIGEAAGFVLIEAFDGLESSTDALAVIEGHGESSDGYHMAAPDPEGLGALIAMKKSLESAALTPAQIDHIVLHGTGTILNDRVENAAVHQLFGAETSASSSKGWTGHTLGAAGILGILTAILAIRDSFLPGNLNLDTLDPAFEAPVAKEGRHAPANHVLVNAFGFGGSNCSIVVGSPA